MTDQLNELYTELGKAYYEGGFEEPLPELLPLFDKITKLKKKMESPAPLFCTNCGAKLDEEDVFCANCGNRVLK